MDGNDTTTTDNGASERSFGDGLRDFANDVGNAISDAFSSVSDLFSNNQDVPGFTQPIAPVIVDMTPQQTPAFTYYADPYRNY